MNIFQINLTQVPKIFFKNLESFKNEIKPKSINFIKEFDHNHILMVNGKLENSEFKFEDKNKIKIKSYNDSNFYLNSEENSLINLNNALSNNGLFLEVANNYRFEKVIIIYNVFTDDLKNNPNVKDKIYKKDKSITEIIYSFIELYFRNNISIENISLIKSYHYFLEKINNTKIYNLDEETLFMEFEDKILNG